MGSTLRDTKIGVKFEVKTGVARCGRVLANELMLGQSKLDRYMHVLARLWGVEVGKIKDPPVFRRFL